MYYEAQVGCREDGTYAFYPVVSQPFVLLIGNDTTEATRTPTATPTSIPTPAPSFEPPRCVGDCDGDDAVTVNEVLTMVNIALGGDASAACSRGDGDGDGAIQSMTSSRP